jgi:hypothetical protein
MNEADLSWLCRGDLFVHHSNRMGRILRRQGRETVTAAKSLF